MEGRMHCNANSILTIISSVSFISVHIRTHSLIVDQMDSQYLAMAKVKATLAKLEAMSFQVVVAIAATATEAWLVARQTA
jgi:hypothetical protein